MWLWYRTKPRTTEGLKAARSGSLRNTRRCYISNQHSVSCSAWSLRKTPLHGSGVAVGDWADSPAEAPRSVQRADQIRWTEVSSISDLLSEGESTDISYSRLHLHVNEGNSSAKKARSCNPTSRDFAAKSQMVRESFLIGPFCGTRLADGLTTSSWALVGQRAIVALAGWL